MGNEPGKLFTLKLPKNRLLQALEEFDPTSIDQVFGNEVANLKPTATFQRAPVKRVALFTEAFFPKVDGVTKSAYMTLRYLQQTGREVLVFAPDISPPQVGESRVIPLPSISFPSAPETRIAFPHPSIRRYLDEFQPDLIHLFSPAWMAASGMREGRRRQLPVVANYQTDLPGYAKQHYGLTLLADPMNRWLRHLHNRCHVNLVASQTILEQLRKDGYRRLHIWRRGVDTTRFGPQNRSEAWRGRLLNGRDPNSLLCIYVGRLAPEKRIDLLVEVARLPGVAFTIVGDGAAREELEQSFAGTDTHFTGYLYGDELAHAYASADVFLFPGPNETFGQVVQEAMASGLPAVIINQGGIKDLVQDGVNGFVCPDDPQAFAQAISRLRDDPELRQRMGQRSREIAKQYPWSAIMTQLEEYYLKAIELNNRYKSIYPDMNLLQLFDPLRSTG
jgi:glycosyltransferase involved in cell wall biosynthesis